MSNIKKTDKKILVVYNKKSGADNYPELEHELISILQEGNYYFRFLTLSEGDMASQISKEVEQYQPKIVIAAGGDGTVNLVAGIILGKKIKMGILPLGSANGLAFELGMPKDPKASMKSILSSGSVKADAFEINGKYLCLHMSDLGMNARVVKRYEKEGSRGMWGYMKQYFREFRNIKKFSCTISDGGKSIRSKVVMLVFANASHYGTGATINPEGKISDGKLEIIMVKAYPLLFLYYMLISFLGVRTYNSDRIEIISVKEASIEISPEQHLQVDGEHIEQMSKLDVKIIPGAIELITPGIK